MEKEVCEGRQEHAEQMRREIMWTSFTKVTMNTGTVWWPGESWMQEVENLVSRLCNTDS